MAIKYFLRIFAISNYTPMRKVILFAVLAAMLCSVTEAQDIMNLRMNREELGIRGNVNTLEEENLYKKDYFREDWPTRKWFRTDLRQFLQEEEGHIYTFTTKGNLQEVTYTKQGNKLSTTRCSYAKNGLMTSFLGEGYKIEGKYKDKSGELNVYAEARSYSGKVDLTTANLKTTNYKVDYPFAYKCRQQLSDDGLVLKSTYYNIDSTLARQTEYTYSSTGRIAEQRDEVYKDGATTSSVTTTSYTYDGNGLLVHKEIRGAGGTESFTYTNNAMGDCVEMLAEHPYGAETYTYEYEYDDNGNWTIRLSFKDGVFDYATIRTLTYGKNVKDKADEVEEEGAPADGDAYYNTYDAAAAHEAAVKAKKEKRSVTNVFKKKDNKAEKVEEEQAPVATDKKAVKEQKQNEKKTMEQQAKQMKKEASMTAKEKAKAQSKAEKKAAKVAKKETVKQAKKDAKAARVQAEKDAKVKAKADKKAAVQAQKDAQKAAKINAKEQEKADKKAAAETAKQAKQAAEEAEKVAVKQAKEQAKAKKEADEQAAKAVAKAAKKQAKLDEQAAKKAAKDAQKQAVKDAKQANN